MSEVADELSSGVLQLIHSVLVSRMDRPTVESVVEKGCTLGSAEGGVVGLGVLGQVEGGHEPSAPELEPILLQNIPTITTLDRFSSDVPSLDGEVVALESNDYKLLVEPLRMLLPSYELVVGEGLRVPSSWILNMVLSFRHLVRVSCEGYEYELLICLQP